MRLAGPKQIFDDISDLVPNTTIFSALSKMNFFLSGRLKNTYALSKMNFFLSGKFKNTSA